MLFQGQYNSSFLIDQYYINTRMKSMSISPAEKENVLREIVSQNLNVKAIIQDISHCNGPIEVLNEFNAQGRSTLARFRHLLDQLEILARETVNEMESKQISKEVSTHLLQYTNTMAAFRQANISALLRIEKADSTELFKYTDEGDGKQKVRARVKKDKESLAKKSSGVTEQLLSISRQLAATTQRSADTLGSLANSSTTISNTDGELHSASSEIAHSSSLLGKYDRRETTDKIVLFFAFAFFFACVLYILYKRLL